MSPRGPRALATWTLLGALLATACQKRGPVGSPEPVPDGTTVTCPVTGASCLKAPDTRSAVFDERNYYFCSDEAWRRFQDAPARYRD